MYVLACKVSKKLFSHRIDKGVKTTYQCAMLANWDLRVINETYLGLDEKSLKISALNH